jgi:hypothetical protein
MDDGLIRCPHCLKHLPRTVRFCRRCGSALPTEVAAAVVPAPRRRPPWGLLKLALLFPVLVGAGLFVFVSREEASGPPVSTEPAPSYQPLPEYTPPAPSPPYDTSPNPTQYQNGLTGRYYPTVPPEEHKGNRGEWWDQDRYREHRDR